MVTKKSNTEASAFTAYLRVRKKAYATIDKDKWKKVKKLEKKLEKAIRKAEKTIDPTLAKEMSDKLGAMEKIRRGRKKLRSSKR
ncbi:MAG: hypothetical protein ACYC6W_04195 [Nitrosotalea sp.]